MLSRWRATTSTPRPEASTAISRVASRRAPARWKKVHAGQKQPPGHHRPRRWRTRRICIGNHLPPFGAAMPRALRSVAMALLDVRPALMQRSMWAQRSSPLRPRSPIDLGLLRIAELDAPCLRGGKCMACALADHVALVLGSGGEHVKDRPVGPPACRQWRDRSPCCPSAWR